MKLLTFPKAKYAEQIVCLANEKPNGMNRRLFDAVELFMTEETWVDRKAVFDSGKAKEFAEEFVAQFNAAIPPITSSPGFDGRKS